MKFFLSLLFIIFLISFMSFYIPITKDILDQSSISVLIDNKPDDFIPKKTEGYYLDRIDCNDDVIAQWDHKSWSLKINNLLKSTTKCKLKFVSCPYSINQQWTYSYSNSSQQFIADCPGNYKLEVWGASGGSISVDVKYPKGGNGGYSSGDLFLEKSSSLYLYLGEMGKRNGSKTLNGGGAAAAPDDACASGGGASDIRLIKGVWDNFDGLKSRILVAGAGAGSERIYPAGVGGGLLSSSSYDSNDIASQNHGYQFGIGQDAKVGVVASGAGGGYFGGGTANLWMSSTPFYYSSAGGSGYASGCRGCKSVAKESTSKQIVITDNSVHYSGYYFSNIVMKMGNEEMPNLEGNGVIKGNEGNGFAKITYLGL